MLETLYQTSGLQTFSWCSYASMVSFRLNTSELINLKMLEMEIQNKFK